jgi:O-antigen/teichoic acid export membrane protein
MKESFKVIAAQSLSFGLQILFMLVSARALGIESQGMYGIARTCAYLAESLMWFGLTSSITHLIASNFERYHAPLFAIAAIYLSAWTLLVLPVVLWVMPAYGIAAGTGLLVLAWTVTLAVTQLFLRVFIGQQRYSLYNGMYLLTSAAIFLPLALFSKAGQISLHEIIWCNIFANALGVVCCLIAHRNHLAKISPSRESIGKTIADFYVVGFKGYISSAAFLLLYRADFFIVGYFAPRMLGIYTVAVFIGEAIQKVPDWLGMMLVPKVSSGQDADGRLTARMLLMSVGFVVSVTALLGGAAVFGFPYVEVLLGKEYYGVELLVLALMPKACLHCVIAVYGARLAGRGYTLYHPAAGLVAFAVLVATDGLLFRFLGIGAAIIGITIAYAVAGSILAVGARKMNTVG